MGAHLTTDSSPARPVLKDMQHWFTWKICGTYVEHIIYTFRSKRFSIFLEFAKKTRKPGWETSNNLRLSDVHKIYTLISRYQQLPWWPFFVSDVAWNSTETSMCLLLHRYTFMDWCLVTHMFSWILYMLCLIFQDIFATWPEVRRASGPQISHPGDCQLRDRCASWV